MMIGVSSYSYSRLVNSGAMKQIDVIAKAKEMGFDCIEFSTIAVPEGKTLPEFAAELKAEADRVGIPIMNYTIGADLLAGSNGDLDAEVERLKKEVDIAEILGAPGCAMTAPAAASRRTGKARRPLTPRCRKSLRAAAP